MGGYVVGGFFLVLVLACWGFVIGHQLGFIDFHAPRYSIQEAVIPIAYATVGLSLCFVTAVITVLMFKK